MWIYAGIDEAGYGPMFGPLTIACCAFSVADKRDEPAPGDASAGSDAQAPPTTPAPAASGGASSAAPARAGSMGDAIAPPCLWTRLGRAVCKDLVRRRGRIAVNDSKKLYTPASGLKHLELGALSFAALAGHKPSDVGQWLDVVGETTHRELWRLPWYCPQADWPWEALPTTLTAGEMAVAGAMLSAAAKQGGVAVVDLGAAVVFEDRFNRMVAATRSKASASFTFVAGHLRRLWERFGAQHPWVVVDRQSGRTHYRELLAMNFPEAHLQVVEENDQVSSYQLADNGPQPRRMTVRFQVEAEQSHLPVALASMMAKYSRELLMARFQAWFSRRAPQVKPTAGYASDAQRFWREIEPLLPNLGVDAEVLRRKV